MLNGKNLSEQPTKKYDLEVLERKWEAYRKNLEMVGEVPVEALGILRTAFYMGASTVLGEVNKHAKRNDPEKVRISIEAMNMEVSLFAHITGNSETQSP